MTTTPLFCGRTYKYIVDCNDDPIWIQSFHWWMNVDPFIKCEINTPHFAYKLNWYSLLFVDATIIAWMRLHSNGSRRNMNKNNSRSKMEQAKGKSQTNSSRSNKNIKCALMWLTISLGSLIPIVFIRCCCGGGHCCHFDSYFYIYLVLFLFAVFFFFFSLLLLFRYLHSLFPFRTIYSSSRKLVVVA